jgi:hypothetical protein
MMSLGMQAAFASVVLRRLFAVFYLVFLAEVSGMD